MKPVIFLYSRSHPNYDIHLHDVETLDQVEQDINDLGENRLHSSMNQCIKKSL